MNDRQKAALRLLRAIPRADIYEGASAENSERGSERFYVSYSGGESPELTLQDVNDLKKRGVIQPRWKGQPHLRCFVLADPTRAPTDG